jgi:hypothetical protein
MISNPLMDLFSFITVSGIVYLAQRNLVKSQDDSPYWNWSVIRLPDIEPKATCIAINSSILQIAVGTSSGVTFVYRILESRTGVVFSHKVEVIQLPGSTFFSVGPVSSLEFSSDGYALGVGWWFGGASVWSHAGRVLWSTMNEETLAESPSERAGVVIEDYFNGVKGLVSLFLILVLGSWRLRSVSFTNT